MKRCTFPLLSVRELTLRFRREMLCLLAVSIPVIASCGGGGGGGSTASTPTPIPSAPVPPTTIPTPAPTPVLSVSASALSNFTVKLEENTDAISAGGSVGYTLRLINTSSSSATIDTDMVSGKTVPKATLRITNSQGVVVYPVQHAGNIRPGTAHGDPPAPPSVNSSTVTLAPGEQLTPLTRSIAAFSVPGVYKAQAVFSVASTSTDTPQTASLPPLSVTVK